VSIRGECYLMSTLCKVRIGAKGNVICGSTYETFDEVRMTRWQVSVVVLWDDTI